ncbi:MAG: hypothetical protein FJ356_02030 [Thaumarchaeota archaeon]|nr:hypothetical protein [Nitrososphaerota archaeon]
MGIIDGHIGFDKFFLGAELFHKIILEVIQAKIQGLLGVNAQKVEFDQKALYRVTKIWNGHTYLVNKWDENQIQKEWCKFFYDRPEPHPSLEIIQLPALDNMNPVGHIRDKTWWIQIREEVPFRYAFDGCNYSDIVNDGNYSNFIGMQTVPKFSEDDMYSLNLTTRYVSRRYFDIVINELKNHWLDQKAILYTNLHRMLQAMKMGNFQTIDNTRKSLVGDID